MRTSSNPRTLALSARNAGANPAAAPNRPDVGLKEAAAGPVSKTGQAVAVQTSERGSNRANAVKSANGWPQINQPIAFGVLGRCAASGDVKRWDTAAAPTTAGAKPATPITLRTTTPGCASNSEEQQERNAYKPTPEYQFERLVWMFAGRDG